MRIQTFIKTALLASLLLYNACRENPKPTIAVGNDGSIVLYGQKVTLDSLRTTLLDSLLNMAGLPENIDITYGDKLLMGIRGEVQTEVNAALTLAREARLKPVVEQRRFAQQQGTDCDQPDSLRNDCAMIRLDYPVVYFKEPALRKNVQTWVTDYLTGMLTNGDGAKSLEMAANIFFNAREDFKGSAMYGAFVAECSFEVLYNEGNYLTLEINAYSFQGGAHGNPSATVATFDTRNGKQLQWDDLVHDKARLKTLAEQKFRQERAEIFNDGFDFDSTFPFALPANYGLTAQGIYFHYLPYEVGPYAIGSTSFVLPFSTLGSLLKPLEINTKTTEKDPEAAAIARTIHDFYRWYDAFQLDENRNILFTTDKGKHLKLDAAKLDQFYTNLLAGGFISPEFVEHDKAILKKCEALWQQENIDEVPSCLDADRFFCAQDWDMDFWTKAPVLLSHIGNETVLATLSGTEAGGKQEQKLELKKENGKWQITRIFCDLGVE